MVSLPLGSSIFEGLGSVIFGRTLADLSLSLFQYGLKAFFNKVNDFRRVETPMAFRWVTF